MKRFLIGLVLIAIMVVPQVMAQEDDLPEVVLAQNPGMHPEGVEWNGEHFLVGSLTMGTIFMVDDDGTVSPFIEDENLVASIGIHIDHENGVLLVANSDPSAASSADAEGLAQLGAYDLETGESIYFADLGSLYEGRHFANDVTSDEDGNAYVTDSFSPVIYKVDPEGNAEVFLEAEAFRTDGFGLNGIDYNEDGYLLVAVAGTQEVYKVPIDDPGAFTEVELSEPLGIDGMLFNDDGHLVAVASTSNGSAIVELASDDDWASATVVASGQAQPEASPTTATIRDGAVYVVHAHFNEMNSGETVDEFEILRVDLESMDDMDEDADSDDMDEESDTEDSDSDGDSGADSDSGSDPDATEEVSG